MKKTWITTALLATFVSLPTAIYAQDIQPESDSNLLIWTDTTTLDYMKYAAESFNQDFGYKVKFSFRGLAPIDAASRMIQDGGSARVADISEIEHDLLGKLVVAGGAMENLISAEHIQSTFFTQRHRSRSICWKPLRLPSELCDFSAVLQQRFAP